MDIEFECSDCGQHVAIDEAGAGLTVLCPKCGNSLTVPRLESQPATSVPLSQALPLGTKQGKSRRVSPLVVVGLICALAAFGLAVVFFTSLWFSARSNPDEQANKLFMEETQAVDAIIQSFETADAIPEALFKHMIERMKEVADRTIKDAEQKKAAEDNEIERKHLLGELRDGEAKAAQLKAAAAASETSEAAKVKEARDEEAAVIAHDPAKRFKVAEDAAQRASRLREKAQQDARQLGLTSIDGTEGIFGPLKSIWRTIFGISPPADTEKHIEAWKQHLGVTGNTREERQASYEKLIAESESRRAQAAERSRSFSNAEVCKKEEELTQNRLLTLKKLEQLKPQYAAAQKNLKNIRKQIYGN